MNTSKKTSTLLAGATWLVVSMALLCTAAMGHNVEQHGAQKAGTAQDDYKRSVKAYVIPDVQLTDYDDRPVRLRELLSGSDPVMLNFVFTSCATICPVTTKVLSEVPARLGLAGRQLRLVSISIDPEADTPLQLKAYARSFQAGERWKFLTGSVQDIKAVQLAFDSYRGDKMNHEPVTLMRQRAAKEWIRIDGFASPNELVREYRKVSSQ